MRVTTGLLVSRTKAQLAQRLEQYQGVQNQLASGKRFERPSQDVAGMDRSMRTRSALSNRLQEARNAEDARQWIDLADGNLQTVSSLLQRARELVVSAGSPANQTAKDAIANEILSIRDEMVGIANDKSQGHSLFAGTLPTDAVTLVGGVWTYTGNGDKIGRRLSAESSVAINVTGDDVFGFNAGSDTFSVLEQAAAAIRAGDVAGTEASIAAIDGSLDHVLEGLAELGTAGSRVEQARVTQQRDIGSLEQMLSDIEDIDLAETIMDMQLQEVAYQSALHASSRAFSPSLMDFMR
jgi:flagellar hook-associated protein 3 FlgL